MHAVDKSGGYRAFAFCEMRSVKWRWSAPLLKLFAVEIAQNLPLAIVSDAASMVAAITGVGILQNAKR